MAISPRTRPLRREEALKQISAHRTDLTRLGVRSLRLFGSVARDDADAGSDVDVLVGIQPPHTWQRYVTIKFFLEDLLEHEVDLVMDEAVKPQMRAYIERDAIEVA